MSVDQLSQRAKILLVFNAESVLRKWTKICSEISVYKASIIAVTETWLSEDIVHFYTYGNYQQFSHCRRGGGGGGVLMFFDPSFSVLQLAAPPLTPDSCQLLPIVDVSSGHCWILVYRPPRTCAEDTRQLFASIEELLSNHRNVTILGDFNLPDINWSVADTSGLPVAHTAIGGEFLELCAAHDMNNLVTMPTRGDNTLDLLITNDAKKFCDVSVQPPVLTSTHDSILCK